MDYSFFDSLIDAVFVVDEQRRIKYCNESAATMCQSSVRRLTKGEGVEIYNILKISEEKSFVNEKGEWGKTEPAPWVEVDLQLSKGDFNGKVQVAIQPFTQPNGESRWVITFHDVTLEENLHQKYQGELEQKEEMIHELQEARGKLEKYSKNLEQMVEERTEEVRKANTMLKAIMDSLGQGFLVFDEKGRCGEIYTKACLDVLENDPHGKNIQDVLRLKDSDQQQFENWSTATFSQALPFSSMKELAPSMYQHSQNKFITLDYFPIFNAEESLTNIVLVATDKTAEHEANIALEKERAFAKMVIKLIKNRTQFSDFLNSAKKTINSIIEIVANNSSQLDFDYMFRLLHTLEGESGAFSASMIRDASRNCQTYIEPYRNQEKEFDFSSRRDLLAELKSLEVSYEEFLIENQEVFSVVLFEKGEVTEVPMSELLQFAQRLEKENVSQDLQKNFKDRFLRQDFEKMLYHYNDVAQQVAKKQDKELMAVKFRNDGVKIYPEYYKNFFASLVHAFRNAVDHGLESPDERQAEGKRREGQIEVHSKYIQKGNQPWIEIRIRDDGRGISAETIRKKLAGSKNNKDFSQASDHEVIQQIFNPGFTSRDEVTEFSGRGVGMDAIRAEVLKLGGHIEVFTEVGTGTEIVIEIPEISSENIYDLSA
ncbi:MAG: PAS domain-containing protein [Bdellovibrionales bacterium]|nr:PAS domain-containing protein [Bdellovibrionales bacterium]